MAETSISFTVRTKTINSITLEIRSTGDNLNKWQYNCLWDKDDSWINGTLESQGDYSTLTITKLSESPAPGKPLNPCTIYGVSLRAKNENTGTWVTSLHQNIKTKGEAEIKSVNDYTIWETEKMSWVWSIYDLRYVYDVYILDSNDDPIIAFENITVPDKGEELTQEIKLTPEQNNNITELGVSPYKLHVNTKDSLGNIVGMSEENIKIDMTSDSTRLKPIFDDFTITPDQDVKKGFTEVTLDYRFKAMAKDGATIKNYIITIGNEEHQDTSTIGVYSFIPDTAGSNTIQITAVDTKERSTSVTKYISVDDYKPIKIDEVTISRNSQNEQNIDITMKVTSYTTPTSLHYSYRKVSNGEWVPLQEIEHGGWNPEGNNKYSCTKTDLDTIDETVDILVYLVVSDGISKAYTNPYYYVYSGNIISITARKVEDKTFGTVKVNEQGIMAYQGNLSDLDNNKDGGTYVVEDTQNNRQGFLEVITSPDMSMERLTVYHTNDNNRYDVFIRFKINSNYTDWKQVY